MSAPPLLRVEQSSNNLENTVEVLLFQAAIIAVVHGLYSWLGRDWALGTTLLMTVGSLFLLFEPALTAVTMATA